MTIQEKLQELSEDDLREQVVIPLMGALGCTNVRSEHGSSEFGKDVVYCSRNVFGYPHYGAIVLKAERINQGPVLVKVQQQTQEALTVLHTAPPDLTTSIRMREVTVMTSHGITHNARAILNSAMGSGWMPLVHVVDGDGLTTLIRDVIRAARRGGLATAEYEFDPSNFHELCERVMQGLGVAGTPETPTISATSGESAEII